MTRVTRVIVGLVAPLIFASCANRSPVDVAVVFANSWTLGSETLTPSEQDVVKAAMFDTLRRAYAGFAIHFAEGSAGHRLVTVEDTPYGTMAQFRAPGPAG